MQESEEKGAEAGRADFPSQLYVVESTHEQRVRQLEAQLREQKRHVETQLRAEQVKNLLLRTMLQVVEDHAKSISKQKLPPENPSGSLALFRPTLSRTGRLG